MVIKHSIIKQIVEMINDKQTASTWGNSKPGKARISASHPWRWAGWTRPQEKAICLLTLFIALIPILSLVSFAIPTHALTYQDTLDTYFTFNSSISLSLSSADLVINDLSPNTYADSNIIDVITNTNNPTGYTLNASVGNSSTYANTNLISTGSSNNGNTTYFSSLATTDSITSLSDMDTSVNSRWGYSFSTDSGTTWINANKTGAVHNLGYSGLPHFSTTPLELYNTNTNGSSIIKFKIGAKTTTNQIADTYSNVVNFTAVANYVPASIDNLIYMQDFADLTATEKAEVLGSMTEGQQYQLIDNRDNIKYWIAKQADGKVWMTQNLDLCVGCDGVATLTSENTDLNVAGTGIYANGYTTSPSGVITWTPIGSTMQGTPAEITNYVSGGTVTGWINSYTAPYMAEGGAHWVTNNTPYSDYAACASTRGVEACDHGRVGDYYNRTASIASNDSTALRARYADADNSICPSGWRLPDGPDGTNGSEFNSLLLMAGIANGTDPGSNVRINVGYKSGGLAKMEGMPYYLGRYGYVNDTIFIGLAIYGDFWSRSVSSDTNAFYLAHSDSLLYPASQDNRSHGRNVRCMAR